MTAPIELFYWPTPNGWKVSIFLEEAGLPYNLNLVNITEGDQFKPDFLKISPNNRMPAIVDPEGPGGAPISVFESGAILQYLGRKTGKFYPGEERARVKVDEWLMWQMGGVGPMLGQFHHFHHYAPEKIAYAMNRYANEAHRLYGVLDKQLSENEYVAGEAFSIADISLVGWTKLYERHNIDPAEFPHFKRWIDAMLARPGVQRGLAVGEEKRSNISDSDKAKEVLFGQRAR